MKCHSRLAFAAIALTVLGVSPGMASAQSIKWGDVNGDGVVGAVDAQAILSAVVGLSLPATFTAANGDANCDTKLGAVDAQIVLSYVVGLTVSQFCVGTAILPSVASVVPQSATYQIVRTSSTVWALPSVVVRDPNNLPMNGVDVTFALTSGGGAISGATTKTNASGVATVGSWTVGSGAGENKLTATARDQAPAVFTAVSTVPADGKTDPMAGFAEFAGKYPTPVPVTYTADGVTLSTDAYPGQLELFFTTATTEATADQVLRANAAIILAQAPLLGHYVVEIATGTETATIAALQSDSRILAVQPNLATSYGGVSRVSGGAAFSAAAPGIWVIDDCLGPHGISVTGTVTVAGGKLGGCMSDASALPDRGALGQTIQHLLKIGGAPPEAGVGAPGSDRLVNLSTYGGDGTSNDYTKMTIAHQALIKGAWKGTFRNFLFALSALSASGRKNLVVGICAGNNNAPLTPWITELRGDARLAAVLKQNVLIVGANDAAYPGASDAPGDPDFVKMTNASSATGGLGCSFATPRALVDVQKVIEATGLSAEDALLATKEAAFANINQELILTEAIAKGNDIASVILSDAAGARNVTGIAFTGVGSTTGAVITPVIASVTVSYTVSGSDGYFDSGRLRTSASGQVTFGIPPGATGVVDQITVTAVLSGVSAKVQHPWP
jgi:hypothetical protein